MLSQLRLFTNKPSTHIGFSADTAPPQFIDGFQQRWFSYQVCQQVQNIFNTMVANNWSKFRLLMWKNSMLQWRKPKQTFFVFAVPVFFTAILLLYSRTGESVVVDTATVYPPIPIGNLAALRYCILTTSAISNNT